MTKKDVVRDDAFAEVAEVWVDSKNRIALGRAGSLRMSSYKVYKNTHGQIILDPQVTIPAAELWLFRNKNARRLVQKGLEDAKKGRLAPADEDYSKYNDDLR
jgi:hypothetical protein